MAQAQDSGLSWDANGGGTTFSQWCAQDQVLIGIWWNYNDLFLGSFLAMAPVCRGVNGQGQWLDGPDATGPITKVFFDVTTTNRQTRCGQNQAVDYIRTESVNDVKHLVVTCKSLAPNGTVTGASAEAGRYPDREPLGVEGIKVTYLPCPNSLPARGLYGARGLLVDRIGLRCGAPFVAAKVEFQRTSVRTGEGNVGFATINRPNNNPLPVAISLTSNVAGVSVPAGVLLMPGAKTVVFAIGTPSVTSKTTVTITAKPRGATGPGASASFVIQP
jgi:hypothetical protein